MSTCSRSIAAAALLLAGLLGGCMQPQVGVPVQRPAEVDLSGIEQVAVQEFAGEGGLEITEELTQQLVGSGRFQVIEREQVGRLLAENRLAADGLIDRETAVRLGRLLGVEALVYGRVAIYDYWEETASEDKKALISGEEYQENIRRGTARVEATFNVVDLETGRLVASKSIPGQFRRETSARDGRAPAISEAAVLAGARRQAVRQFMTAIAPYEEMVRVELLTDDKIPELERGVALIRINEWHEALEIFEEAVAQNPESAEALYNLGIAFQYTYQFDRAEEYLKAAYMIDSNKQFEDAINHLRRMEVEAENDAVLAPPAGTEAGAAEEERDVLQEELDLASVQRTLNELGYDCGTVDGEMGPRTSACIRAFQRDGELEETGRLDERTRTALREVIQGGKR